MRPLRQVLRQGVHVGGLTEGLPAPPPLPICPACRHTLNLLTPFFMQSLGMDLDDLIAEAQPFVD